MSLGFTSDGCVILVDLMVIKKSDRIRLPLFIAYHAHSDHSSQILHYKRLLIILQINPRYICAYLKYLSYQLHFWAWKTVSTHLETLREIKGHSCKRQAICNKSWKSASILIGTFIKLSWSDLVTHSFRKNVHYSYFYCPSFTQCRPAVYQNFSLFCFTGTDLKVLFSLWLWVQGPSRKNTAWNVHFSPF